MSSCLESTSLTGRPRRKAASAARQAQGVAWSLWSLGPRNGQMAIGQLRPEPAVLWAMGAGQAPPLVLVEHWSTVPKH